MKLTNRGGSAFPIVDPDQFWQQFDYTYDSLLVGKTPVWCAMVNLVLAIGCRATPGCNEDEMCNLFGNSLAILPKILLSSTNLQKVQTLTLMV